MSHPTDSVPQLVRQLYEVVTELEKLFPNRKFTPDGHLVGSIGDVWAARRYDLQLVGQSVQGYDAIARDGRRVEIKVTQGDSVAMREEPEHLIVLQISRVGSLVECFNGPGKLAWSAAGKMQVRNGQRSIALSKLRALMEKVPESTRLEEQIQ